MTTDTRIIRGDERDGEHEIVHVTSREAELNRLIEEQTLDLMSERLLDPERAEFFADDAEPDDRIRLLDPIVAYEREARRMSAAGPRRRITAADLDARA
jgi:hypothetical protein